MRGHDKPHLPSSPHPADYPLGSMASRAAARAMLERRERRKERIRVSVVLVGHREGDPLPEDWRVQSERGVTEIVHKGDGGKQAATNLGPGEVVASRTRPGTAVEGARRAGGQALPAMGHDGEAAGPVKINVVIEDVGA
jgi:hypothetical protein